MTVELPVELVEAVETFINTHRPKTSKTAIVEAALEEYLTKLGYWPAKADDDSSDDD